MNAEVKKELLRINQLFEEEKGVSYFELNFLQAHKQEVLELGDVRLAERSGISEEEWNRGELLQEDEAFCSWCGDIFDKSELKEELNLGLLCDTCIRAIKSRGEELILKN